MSDEPDSPQRLTEARRERLRARGGGSLRMLTARGVMVNAAFNVGLQGLAFLRGFIVAAFVAPSDYGIFALLVVGYTTLGVLKQVGIVDKYIQQDDPDEESAFQKAFTLEAILTGGFWLLLMALTPLLAVIYQAPEIILPGLVTLAAMPASVLQTPIWAFARNMDFKRQRTLGSVDPVVGMIVTVALAIAGAGYWAFAVGSFAGAWAGALVIVPRSPYKLKWRYDRGTARQYLHFSKPILVANLGRIVLMQSTVLSARGAVGLAGVGALSLANSIRTYTAFADGVVSSTLYPAVAAVKDRVDLMHESFVKSNRITLMWGMPAGIGIALFAGDLVTYVLGEQWRFAIGLLEATAVVSSIAHVAFNWDVYIRATGDTRPMARAAWIGVAAWLAGPIPLLWIYGLDGYAAGLYMTSAVTFLVRGYYMRKLFPGFAMLGHALRAIVPTIPAGLLILAVRAAQEADRTLGVAAAEAFVFLGTATVFTWLLERELLGEAVGYLRRARGAPGVAT